MSVAPPFCSVRNVLQCFHIFVTMPLAASTYPAWKAVISLRVSSEYRPIGELYCFLWVGLTPTLPSAGLEGALQVDEQPFACTNWGFTGREQSMVGNAINNSADKIICWSMMSPFKEDDQNFFWWLKIIRSFWNILGLTFFKIQIFGDVLNKVFFSLYPTLFNISKVALKPRGASVHSCLCF